MKVYISGAITGVDNYKEIFRSVADRLWSKPGYIVVNPCSLAHNHDESYESYMKEDIKALLECDRIYMIDGWKKSKGARFEFLVARMCGIRVLV